MGELPGRMAVFLGKRFPRHLCARISTLPAKADPELRLHPNPPDNAIYLLARASPKNQTPILRSELGRLPCRPESMGVLLWGSGGFGPPCMPDVSCFADVGCILGGGTRSGRLS